MLQAIIERSLIFVAGREARKYSSSATKQLTRAVSYIVNSRKYILKCNRYVQTASVIRQQTQALVASITSNATVILSVCEER